MDYVEHLESLGLAPGASPHEIRRAYREQTAVLKADVLPDDPGLRRQAQKRLDALAVSYRFLMKRHALEPVDLEDPDALPPPVFEPPADRTPARGERLSRSSGPAKASRRAYPRIPIVRMVLVTAVVFLLAAYLIPAAREGELGSLLSGWVTRARGLFGGTEGGLFQAEEGGVERPTGSSFVFSLPGLTKPQVQARYGIPELQEPGKWTYSGFSILFQDDSVASLMVRDSLSR